MAFRKTKIVCSIGPASEDPQIITQLLRGGMNVARFNFSHGTHEYHQKIMEAVREASRTTGIPVAIMLDTKGPEIRTGDIAQNEPVLIHTGDSVLVSADGAKTQPASPGQSARISVSWKNLPQEVKPGVRILIADGLLELLVKETDGAVITAEALNDGHLGSKKNVNILGVHPNLPVMTDQDKDDIAFGVKMGIDFIAASFVCTAADVVEIRKYLTKLKSKARIIAKIETQKGLDNIKEITSAADGVMVARGDLGVQLPMERIPLAQKQIIACCRSLKKPVITATQLLDSMIVNPRPTRAELTDVANAIFDGTDAVMLSGETAGGAYPVAAVETMSKIALSVEESEDYKHRSKAMYADNFISSSIAETVTLAAYIMASDIAATAILTPTMSGNTARMLSTYHPEQSIIAVTPSEQNQRQLLLNWGVEPLVSKLAHNSDEMVQNAMRAALDAGAIKISDKVIMVAGIPIISPVMVNTVRVILVGNILARGLHGNGQDKDAEEKESYRITGRIICAKTTEEAVLGVQKEHGEILVCPTITMDYLSVLRSIKGLIVEGDIEIPESLIVQINPNLIWVSQVHQATAILENGLTVTIDSKELIIYEGTI